MEKKKTTKELLRQSVIELVSAMPIEKVTVNKICENCGVSQRSFYNYFRDKHDLIAWVYTGVLTDVFSDDSGTETLHSRITALVNDICDNSDFYMNAVRYTGQNNFMKSVFEPLRKSTLNLISKGYGDKITLEISNAVDFYIFGCLGCMEYHLLLGDIVPAKTTIAIFEANIPPVLAKYV